MFMALPGRVLIFFLLLIMMTGFFSCNEKRTGKQEENILARLSPDDLKADTIIDQSEYDIRLNAEPDPNRGAWQNPDLVIKKLGDLSGKIVADIGSGTGYFTFPISRKAKKVIAIDIEQRYLDYIEDRKLELPIEQAEVIETRLTVEDEPNLHTDEVDAVLMVNVFYYLKNRAKYMKIVNNALRDGGILVLVDFKPGDLPVGPSEDKVPTGEVMKDLKTAGFKNITVDTTSLQYQYIITAN